MRSSKATCSSCSSEFQITIPELGTVRAAHPPLVILTSNRTREVHDALKRRCLYQWIDYPAFEKEMAIVKSDCLTRRRGSPRRSRGRAAVAAASSTRSRACPKRRLGGRADRARSRRAGCRGRQETIGVLLKAREDLDAIRGGVLARARSRARRCAGSACGSVTCLATT